MTNARIALTSACSISPRPAARRLTASSKTSPQAHTISPHQGRTAVSRSRRNFSQSTPNKSSTALLDPGDVFFSALVRESRAALAVPVRGIRPWMLSSKLDASDLHKYHHRRIVLLLPWRGSCRAVTSRICFTVPSLKMFVVARTSGLCIELQKRPRAMPRSSRSFFPRSVLPNVAGNLAISSRMYSSFARYRASRSPTESTFEMTGSRSLISPEWLPSTGLLNSEFRKRTPII